jgi:hypothetical protein
MTGPKLKRLVAFRLTDQERAAIIEAAGDAGLSLSQWLRLVTITATGDLTLLEQLQSACTCAARAHGYRL